MEIFFIFLTELIIQGIVIYFYNYKPFIDFSISICMVFFFLFCFLYSGGYKYFEKIFY